MKYLIKDFEIVDHGVHHSQYFQGCGVSMTKFDDCFTGIGRSLKEALGDALEGLASEYDLSSCALVDDCEASDDSDAVTQSYVDCKEKEPEDSELYYYASIRVSTEKD